MAKHRGEARDVVALGPEPTLAVILEPDDAPLMEKLLMHYANAAYYGGPDGPRWRGFKMRHDQARRLAMKIRRAHRG